jgi:uncharacterized protein (TIGR03437 family)
MKPDDIGCLPALRALLPSILVAFSAFSQTYTINTIAGGGLPVNVPGTSAGLGSTSGGIAVDSAGNVFIAAQDYNIVLRLDAASGVLTLVAGNGTYGFSGDNGPAGSAQLAFPAGVAVDSAGNVYIADAGNGRVRKVSHGVITTVAGGGASLGDNGPASSALLSAPVGVALDSAGNLYIADAADNRIRKVSNGLITTVAGNRTQGFGGDNGPATNAELHDPGGVAVDSAGNVYIADTQNNRIREVSNGIIATVAGAGLCSTFMRFGQTGNGDNGPATSAQLCGPEGVATDSAGNFYIADGWNLIREVSGGIITAVAGGGTSLGDNGPATSALLGSPSGIAFDSSGNLYIADGSNERIRKVSGGIITTVAGNGTGFGGDNGLATSAQLDLPSGVAVDSTGSLYIGDARNGRVRKVSNGVIATVAGNGTPGFSGDDGPATAAQLNGFTYGLAVDSAGNLYIADAYNCRVRKVSNGLVSTIAGNGICGFSGDNGPATSSQVNVPSDVAVDSAGNIYIADMDNNRIRKISNSVITTVAGSVTGGFAGDGGDATNAELSFPGGVAVDSAGNLYIADTNNGRIRRVSGGVITTVAGNGSGYSGDNGPATSAGLSYPSSIAVDSAGSLYIAGDPYRIRKVSGGVITTVAGAGATVADGVPPASATLDASSIAIDPSGSVYISDTGNDRVRVLTPSGASCTYTVNPLSFAAVGSSGGNFVATIQTASGCTWAVQSLPQWIAWSGNAIGTGPATITLAAAANSGDDRSAVVSIAGVPVVVSQAGTGSTVNGASYSAALVPGSVASVFGSFSLSSAVTATQYPLPTNISGLSVQLDGGTLAPLFFASSGQINFQVPWELAGQSQTTLTVIVNGQAGTAQTVSLAGFAPAIFTVNDQGTGQGAILDLSNRLVDSTHPASAGDWVSIFCTGLGAVGYQPATGSPASIPTGPDFPLSWALTEPAVTIGGVQTALEYWGLAPGYVGLYQLNANVPDVAPGNAVPVTVYIGGAVSNTVTMAIR